jgi:hypothetical protein
MINQIRFKLFILIYQIMFVFKGYLSEIRPFILTLVSFLTFVCSKLNNRFEKYVDPLFWLTQHIHEVLESRQNSKVRIFIIKILFI